MSLVVNTANSCWSWWKIYVFVLHGLMGVMWMALDLANDLSLEQGNYVEVRIELVSR